jgi:hypothetical protein
LDLLEDFFECVGCVGFDGVFGGSGEICSDLKHVAIEFIAELSFFEGALDYFDVHGELVYFLVEYVHATFLEVDEFADNAEIGDSLLAGSKKLVHISKHACGVFALGMFIEAIHAYALGASQAQKQ